MRVRRTIPLIVVLSGAMLVAGCGNRSFWGGAATGAVVTGGAYEYQQKRAMDQLEEDYQAGRISRDEYERRKAEIRRRSLLQ